MTKFPPSNSWSFLYTQKKWHIQHVYVHARLKSKIVHYDAGITYTWIKVIGCECIPLKKIDIMWNRPSGSTRILNGGGGGASQGQDLN